MPRADALAAQRAEVERTEAATAARVTNDRDHQRTTATATPLPGAAIAALRAIDARAVVAADGWGITKTPLLTAT